MKKQLKLYVWEDVLSDYTSGIMFALAEDADHARRILLEECDYIPKGDLAGEPEEVKEAKGYLVWGVG